MADKDKQEDLANEPIPAPTDPGGAHAKGYSADPAPEKPVGEEGDLPVSKGPGVPHPIHVPERDTNVRPTGRGEEKDYTPNDRLMGSDR
jgi:hypothetical protein